MPTLFLICGLPGSGKTTLARKLEAERPALRLSPDEWMAPLFGTGGHIDQPQISEQQRTQIEALQWQVAARALVLGMDVILENGFWSRAERDAYRARGKACGAKVELHFLDISREELWQRIKKRNTEAGAFHVNEHDLDAWSRSFESPSADEL